jgi:hypothetical protein
MEVGDFRYDLYYEMVLGYYHNSRGYMLISFSGLALFLSLRSGLATAPRKGCR